MMGFLLTSICGVTLSPLATVGVELLGRALLRGLRSTAVLDPDRPPARPVDPAKQYLEPEK